MTLKSPPLAQVVALRPAVKKPRVTKPLAPLTPEAAEDALREMARNLTGHASPSEALRAQLQWVHTLFRAKASYVARHDASRDQLLVEHVRGRNDQRITAVRPGEGAVGKAFETQNVVREAETVAIPLENAQGVSGCLVLLGVKRAASDGFLLTLGAQLAAAYELARIRDDGARRQKDLQTAIAGLKSLEQNRDELLGNISHDLKNPLTTIKTYLALLEGERLGSLAESQRRALKTCERNADRMLRMVSDLVLMSRLQSGEMQLDDRAFGIKALAEEVLRGLHPLAEQSRVRLELPATGEVFVRGDREQMSEAIHHLVEHAIWHSPEQGQVELRVSGAEGFAVLAITDQGPRLEADARQHLFDAFYRPAPGKPRPSNAGLGLPLVAKIVTLHGGRVDVMNGEGDEGNRYHMALPLFASAVPAPDEPSSPPRSGGILLVEDDDDCREVLREVLEYEGYRVTAAAGAEEARTLLAKLRPAMLLLDLRLSHEDGRSVLRYVRSTPELADIAVYLISGASEVASLASGTGLDRIDGFFEKPLPLPKLLDTVASVVRPNRSPS